jgi:hypothetical protein
MNYKYLLILIIVLCAFVSYVSFGKIRDKSAKTKSATVINGNSTALDNNRIGENPSSEFAENETTPREGARETTSIAADNSKITTVFDRYGNKIETRYFNSHPLLSLVTLRTTSEGYRQVFVYGQNGDVRQLPENMLDKVTTASADEIANSAGITTRVQGPPQPDFVLNNSLPSAAPVQARQYNQLPTQTEPNEAVTTEENTEAKTTEDSEKKIPPAQETIILNRPPEKE